MVLEIITIAIAVYGAALSTYIFISQRKENQRQVKVKLSAGLMTPPALSKEFMLFIEVINTGNRKVTINGIGLRLPEGQTVISRIGNSHVTLPYVLEEGKNCHFWFEMRDLAVSLTSNGKSGKIKLRGFARDGADNTYVSKPYPIEIEQWLTEE